MLQEKERLRNHRVFQAHWDRAEIFVASGGWEPSAVDLARRIIPAREPP
jgi:hypothetical protein